MTRHRCAVGARHFPAIFRQSLFVIITFNMSILVRKTMATNFVFNNQIHKRANGRCHINNALHIHQRSKKTVYVVCKRTKHTEASECSALATKDNAFGPGKSLHQLQQHIHDQQQQKAHTRGSTTLHSLAFRVERKELVARRRHQHLGHCVALQIPTHHYHHYYYH